MKLLIFLTVLISTSLNVYLTIALYHETARSLGYEMAYESALKIIEAQSRTCSAARNPNYICKERY